VAKMLITAFLQKISLFYGRIDMRKKSLSLLIVSVLITLLLPASSLAKTDSQLTNTDVTPKSAAEKEIILVKNVSDSQYNDVVDTNAAFLKDHIVDKAFDFTGIMKELKSRKDSAIIGSYNKNLKNNTYSYAELLDKITDLVYDNCCSSFVSYEKKDFNSLIHKEFGETLKSGEKIIKTILFAAQNKKTGLFITFAPVTIEVSAEKDITTPGADESLLYKVDIKSLNYVILGGGSK
jgi:hypothetical protein